MAQSPLLGLHPLIINDAVSQTASKRNFRSIANDGIWSLSEPADVEWFCTHQDRPNGLQTNDGVRAGIGQVELRVASAGAVRLGSHDQAQIGFTTDDPHSTCDFGVSGRSASGTMFVTVYLMATIESVTF